MFADVDGFSRPGASLQAYFRSAARIRPCLSGLSHARGMGFGYVRFVCLLRQSLVCVFGPEPGRIAESRPIKPTIRTIRLHLCLHILSYKVNLRRLKENIKSNMEYLWSDIRM